MLKILTLLISLAVLSGVAVATTEAKCLVYMPINMSGEGTVIKLPKNRTLILAVPYSSFFSVVENPYHAIAMPYHVLKAPMVQGVEDVNLVSLAGIKIKSECTFKEHKVVQELVTVDLTHPADKEQMPDGYVPSDEIVQLTLECIRRMATDEHQQWFRPTIKIIGKAGDEKKWKAWEDAFNQQKDFSQPFQRPKAP